MRSCLGCLGLLVLAFAAWLGWTVYQVGEAPIMAEARPRLARYSCVGEDDVILPYSVKLDQFAGSTYYSLGGENFIQAAWLIPLTQLALSIRYDQIHLNRLYAATSGYASRLSPGYDPIAQVLYRTDYCSLNFRQRQVVEFMTFPWHELVRRDPALKAATDRAKRIMALNEDRLRQAERDAEGSDHPYR